MQKYSKIAFVKNQLKINMLCGCIKVYILDNAPNK